MSERKEDENFTPTQVGALIESFRNDVAIIGEKVDSLELRVSAMDERLERVEDKVTKLDDAVRVALPDLFKRVKTLEIKAG